MTWGLIRQQAERENILTRDLSYVQSLMILSEMGLWSGDKRISEISDVLSELTASVTKPYGQARIFSELTVDRCYDMLVGLLNTPILVLLSFWRRLGTI